MSATISPLAVNQSRFLLEFFLENNLPPVDFCKYKDGSELVNCSNPIRSEAMSRSQQIIILHVPDLSTLDTF